MENISFTIPNTPDNRKAINELVKQAENHSYTLYVEDSAGDVIPVADITKHPDCPLGLYYEILRKLIEKR